MAGAVALAFWSHKVCRWFVPLVLAAAQISAATLVHDPVYAVAASLGGMLVLLALVGHRFDLRAAYWAPASIPYYFLSMNLALLLGLIAFLRGTQSTAWTPTARLRPLPAGDALAASKVAARVSEPRVAPAVSRRVAESV
jgi:alpha-beta hydrolase superfamily lysophospholipase